MTVERGDLIGRWSASQRDGIALLLELAADGGYELTLTRYGGLGSMLPEGGDVERGRWRVTGRDDAPRLELTKMERSSAWARAAGLERASSPALAVLRRWTRRPRAVSARILELTPTTLTVGRPRNPVAYRRVDTGGPTHPAN